MHCPVDIMLVLDTSRSVDDDFDMQKALAQRMIDTLPDGDDVRIAVALISYR